MFFRFPRWIAAVLVGISLFAPACTPEPPLATPTPTSLSGDLIPYLSPSPTPSPSGQRNPPRTPTPLPTPTPTPFTYTVAEGDTMLSIALRFGITLEELQAANPDANPRILSVDTALVIPLEETRPEIQPSPTPEALQLDPPRCYSTAEGGVWCYVLATNPNAGALENIVARVRLFTPSEDVAAEGEAIMPLNLLPAREALPLAIFFSPPLPDGAIPQVELLSALPVPEGTGRYLPASVEIDEIEIVGGGLQATVSGELTLPNGSPNAGLIWLALVAYDRDGQVVGVRKWEAESGLASGDSLDFAIDVYSLGGTIDRVEVLNEVRP